MKLSTNAQDENKLPTELTQEVSEQEINYNPLAQAFIALQRVTPNDVYPTNLAQNKVHKIIVSTQSTKLLEGPNGDKDQYIGLVSFGLHIEYKNRIITTKQPKALEPYLKGNELKTNTYTAIFPLRTWNNMFLKSVRQSFAEYYPHVIEVHFMKKNPSNYEMMYCAVVEWDNENKQFKRKIIEYKEHKYKEKR